MDLNTQTEMSVEDALAALMNLSDEVAQAQAQSIVAPTEPTLDDLELTLANLSADTETVGNVEPAPVISADAQLDDDELKDLEIATFKAEAYSDQTSAAAPTEEATTTGIVMGPVQSTVKKARTPRVAGSKPAVRTRDLSLIDESVFKLRTGDTDLAARKTQMMAAVPKQVKIAEKFNQLWGALEAGKVPSRYVVDGYKLLRAQKVVTSTDIVGMFKTMGLEEGTARSQTGQLMVLFDTVEIAVRSGQTLTLNADSAVAERLDAILAQ